MKLADGVVIPRDTLRETPIMMKLITAILVASGFAYALEAPLPISLLAHQADAAVIGRPIKLLGSGNTTSVSFVVERLISGKANGGVVPGTEIALSVDTHAGVSSTLPERGLCFIRQAAAGWSVIPRIANSLEFTSWCFAALPEQEVTRLTAGRQITDRVLAEILLALAVSGPSSPHDLDQALVAIPATSHEEYIQLLNTPANNPLQLGLRFRYSDPDAVAALEKRSDLDPAVLAQVANQMCIGYTSPSVTGIAALGRLALSSDAKRVRECAGYALKAIHIPEAVPALVQLMHAPDEGIRLEGVLGLAFAANSGRIPGERPLRHLGRTVERKQPQLSTDETQRYIPSPTEFHSNEALYTAFWNNWWLTNRHRWTP